jgi:putative transposase
VRPLSLDNARRLVAEYVEHYNTVRLHSAIGCIAPADKLNGRENNIFKARDLKLEAAREQRKLKRQQAYEKTGSYGVPGSSLTHAA